MATRVIPSCTFASTPPQKSAIAVGVAIGVVLEVIAVLGFLHIIPGINAIVAGSLAGVGVLALLIPLAFVKYLSRQSAAHTTNKGKKTHPQKNAIQNVFKFVDAKDMANCRLVCKEWNNAFKGYAPFSVKNISGQYASKAENALKSSYQAVGSDYWDLDRFGSDLVTCHSGVASKRLAGIKDTLNAEEGQLTSAFDEMGNRMGMQDEALEASLLIANAAGDQHSFEVAKEYAKKFTEVGQRDAAYYQIARLEAKFNSTHAHETVKLIEHQAVQQLALLIINDTLNMEVKVLVGVINKHAPARDLALSFIVSDIVKKWALDGKLSEAKALAQQLIGFENSPFLCAIACIDPNHDFKEVRNLRSSFSARSCAYMDTAQALFDPEGAKREARANKDDYYLALSLYNIACIEGKGDFSEALTATKKINTDDLRDALLFRIALSLVYGGQKEIKDFETVAKELASSETYSNYVNALKRYTDKTKESKVVLDGPEEEKVIFQLDHLRAPTLDFERVFVSEFSDTAQKLFACGRIEEGAKIMKGLARLNMHPATRANILLDMRDAIEQSGEAAIKIG